MVSTRQSSAAGKWPSGINVLAGVWLILAPMTLGYPYLQQAVWNDRVVGTAIFVLAVARVAAPARFEVISWINFVLGAWLVVAPFLLAYSAGGSPSPDLAAGTGDPTAAIANDIITGFVVLGMAAWSARATSGASAPNTRDVDANVAQHAGPSPRSGER